VIEIAACRVYRSIGDRSEALPLRRLAGAAVAVLLSCSTAACGISFPMASLFLDAEAETTTTTSSITPKFVSPLSPDLGAEDWRRAKGALAVALDPQGSGTAVSWDNPDTETKGNFAPVGQPFVNTDEICRAFLATLVTKSATTSLQGTACRPSGGEWAIKDMKPWRRPA
jgi:surface antigen